VGTPKPGSLVTIVHATEANALNVPDGDTADELLYRYEHNPGVDTTYAAVAAAIGHAVADPPGSPGSNSTEEGVADTVAVTEPVMFVTEAVNEIGDTSSTRKSIGAFTYSHPNSRSIDGHDTRGGCK
jgi:hypothetical protein